MLRKITASRLVLARELLDTVASGRPLAELVGPMEARAPWQATGGVDREAGRPKESSDLRADAVGAAARSAVGGSPCWCG
jgi:hypothetical protein